MESPEHSPEQLSADQAAEELEEDRGPNETDEPVPTPTDIDEELEDRGDQ